MKRLPRLYLAENEVERVGSTRPFSAAEDLNRLVPRSSKATASPSAGYDAKLPAGDRHKIMTHTCKFCSVFDSSEAPCDRPILRTPNFIVAPSVGALVPGWMLVVSTKHYISAGALPHELLAELRGTINTVAAAMRQTSRTAAIFEHGPARENTVVGCGIDHCHVHVVPLEFDLYSAAGQLSKETGISWEPAADITSTKAYHEGGHPYLYIQQNDVGKIGTSSNPPSQFFRRVIASRQGRPEEFDWRRHDAVAPAHLAEVHRLTLVLPGASAVG